MVEKAAVRALDSSSMLTAAPQKIIIKMVPALLMQPWKIAWSISQGVWGTRSMYWKLPGTTLVRVPSVTRSKLPAGTIQVAIIATMHMRNTRA